MNQADIFFQKGMHALQAEDAETALKFFTGAADLGNLEAWEQIIFINSDEENVEEYKAAANKFFSIAARGNLHAAKIIFNLTANEIFDEEDAAKGAKILLDFAKAGHVESLKFAHELMSMEKISKDNAAEIFALLFEATKKVQSADLMFRLGECYFFGVGTEKNFNAAKFRFQILINLDFAKDIFEKLDVSIAKAYLSNNFKLDEIKNIKNYKCRAKTGDEDAIKIISEIYRNGRGIAPDGKESAEWLKKISDSTNYSTKSRLDALRSIAEIYRYGFGGIQADGEKAIYYFQKMVDLNGENAFAARNIAEIYFHGEGNVKADKAQAVNWLRLAAHYGNLYCMKKLAECYATGHLMEKNEAEAISLYEKILARSDSRGRIDVMKKIAYLYKNIDKKKSDEWYQKANNATQNLNFAFNRTF